MDRVKGVLCTVVRSGLVVAAMELWTGKMCCRVVANMKKSFSAYEWRDGEMPRCLNARTRGSSRAAAQSARASCAAGGQLRRHHCKICCADKVDCFTLQAYACMLTYDDN